MDDGKEPQRLDAFSHLAATGQEHPNRVGATDFTALVANGGRKLSEGESWKAPIMDGSRTAMMTRHRSGSITETHVSADGGSHNAYHFSATANEGRGEVFKTQKQGAISAISSAQGKLF